MNYRSIATAAAAAAAAFALLIGGAHAQTAGTSSGGAGTPQGPSNPNSVDRQFVTQAIQGGDREIDQAKAELNSTTDANVKMFAQRMIADHTTANSQIAAIAKNLKLPYPASHVENVSGASPLTDASQTGTPPPAAQPNAAASSASAVPPRDYMQREVQEHQQAVALFENEAKNGGSPELRAAAGQILPQLQAHLAMAEQYTNTGRITPVSTPTPSSVSPPR